MHEEIDSQISKYPKSNTLLVDKLMFESKSISIKASISFKNFHFVMLTATPLFLGFLPTPFNSPIYSTISKTCKTMYHRTNKWLRFRVWPTWIQFQFCLLQIHIQTHNLPFRCILSHTFIYTVTTHTFTHKNFDEYLHTHFHYSYKQPFTVNTFTHTCTLTYTFKLSFT